MKRHPSRSLLRRLLDEPELVSRSERDHVGSCRRCAQRRDSLAVAAALSLSMLAAHEPADPAADPGPALRRLRSNETTRVPAKPGRLERLRAAASIDLGRKRAVRFGAMGTTVAVLLGTLVATGAAGSLIKIFEPETFVAVPIDITSLATLPDLAGFGTTHILQTPSVTTTASLAEAAAASGLHLLDTGKLPAAIKGQPRFFVAGPGSASFTFDAAAASGTAAKLGRQLPSLPPGLDGAVLTLSGGPIVVETVGSQSGLGLFPSAAPEPATAEPSAPGDSSAGEGAKDHGLGLLSTLGGIPQLVVVQMKAPVLYSDKLTVAQYEDALLGMPGVPPSLAAQVRALGDLSSTLPIPIPRSLASSHAADINGAAGLVIGDTTGIASGVIWRSHGQVYAVLGSLTDSQVVAIARAMH
ncbi:MAG: hypothetical protein NVSMB32_04110 [Actinomycetota bacterium]